MRVEELLARLADRESGEHQRSLRALVDAGSAAVGLLVAALLDEGSPVDWSDAGVILRKIGRPAFEPLMVALSTAPTGETRRRCAWAFMGFGAEFLDEYIAALSHPSAAVRREAALGIQYLKRDGLPAVPALLSLLADPDEEVRQRTVWALAGIGEATVPALQAVRRRGPGRLRKGALTALAEVAGERGLLPEDRAAIERLIRVKLVQDAAPDLDHCAVCGSWLALRTDDQAAVLAALDLSAPQPATLRLGYAAFYCDSHSFEVPDEQIAARVFVTPTLNDAWTLVLGGWYVGWGGGNRYSQATRELSERFGEAQAYWFDAQTGNSSWCLCTEGETVRWYDPDDETAGVGERLPVEQGRRLVSGYENEEDADDEDDEREWCGALDVSRAMSVCPRDIAEAAVRGHGVLALTANGRAQGTPAGALPI